MLTKLKALKEKHKIPRPSLRNEMEKQRTLRN
jgi:hypothetical protein